MNIFKETDETINRAKNCLLNGDVISIKSETVYGLVGDASNQSAVEKIYKLKKRPLQNPLIVHVNSVQMAMQYAIFNPDAEKVAKQFWPGPLTLILPLKKSTKIKNTAVANLNTIAIRVPDSKVFLSLINLTSRPLAAPSANSSGYISSTKAEHVYECFKNNIKMIIDSGRSFYGLESTILDMTENPFQIKRPGVINKNRLNKICKSIISVPHNVILTSKPNSPGQFYKHYSPKTPLYLNITNPNPEDAVLAFGENNSTNLNTLNLSNSGSLVEAAQNLYDFLRKLDKLNSKRIVVNPIPSKGIGITINERLNRAAYKK